MSRLVCWLIGHHLIYGDPTHPVVCTRCHRTV